MNIRRILTSLLFPKSVLSMLVVALMLVLVNITLQEPAVMIAAIVLAMPALGWTVWFSIRRA